MKIRFQLVIISIFFAVIFVPVYAPGEGVDSILFASVEVLPSPVPNPVPDPIPTYAFSQCDDIVVRGVIPTDEVIPVKLEIAEKLTGEIDPIGPIVHTREANSEDSRYWFDISLNEFLSKDTPAGKYLAVLTYEGSRGPEIKTFEFKPKDSCPTNAGASSPEVPDWIKTTAGFWVDGFSSDTEFVNAIQFLIDNGVLVVPTTSSESSSESELPPWIKTTTGYWVNDQSTDSEFVSAIQFLISRGIIKV